MKPLSQEIINELHAERRMLLETSTIGMNANQKEHHQKRLNMITRFIARNVPAHG